MSTDLDGRCNRLSHEELGREAGPRSAASGSAGRQIARIAATPAP